MADAIGPVLPGFSLVCAVTFLPVLRRERVTRFWAAVTLLALAPAATVFPLSKNLGFVAVGAFGVVASFLVHFAELDELLTRQAQQGLPHVPVFTAATLLTGEP